MGSRQVVKGISPEKIFGLSNVRKIFFDPFFILGSCIPTVNEIFFIIATTYTGTDSSTLFLICAAVSSVCLLSFRRIFYTLIFLFKKS
jgi:hypothetical protein